MGDEWSRMTGGTLQGHSRARPLPQDYHMPWNSGDPVGAGVPAKSFTQASWQTCPSTKV
ncbi:hypothetical protein RK21_05521 [Pseudomonas plecoglossicida]|nr:hypothetical protein RK21_05521 [Pseudomonas plecoglossicida]